MTGKMRIDYFVIFSHVQRPHSLSARELAPQVLGLRSLPIVLRPHDARLLFWEKAQVEWRLKILVADKAFRVC